MTTIEYLSQVKELDSQIDIDTRELARWREMSTRVSRGSLEPNYNATRNTEAPFIKCVDNIIVLEKRITSDIERLSSLKGEILTLIHSIDDPDYTSVLELRYLDYMSWEEIAGKMKYGKRWVYSKHKSAIEAFETAMKTVHDNSQ